MNSSLPVTDACSDYVERYDHKRKTVIFLHLLLFCIILSQADFKWRYFTIGGEEGNLLGGSGGVTVKAGYRNTIPQSSLACSASPLCFVEEIFSLEMIEVCVLIVSPKVHGKSLPSHGSGERIKKQETTCVDLLAVYLWILHSDWWCGSFTDSLTPRPSSWGLLFSHVSSEFWIFWPWVKNGGSLYEHPSCLSGEVREGRIHITIGNNLLETFSSPNHKFGGFCVHVCLSQGHAQNVCSSL